MSEQTVTKPDVTKSAEYKAAVTAGRRAAATMGKANWTIGDLAVTIQTSYGDATVQRYADDIGIARGTLYDLRSVARAYADGDRTKNSWTVHQIFQLQDDRVDLVSSKTWTTREARELVKSRKDDDTGQADQADQDTDQDTAEVVETDADKLVRLQLRRDQLLAELAKIDADIAAVSAKLGKATHRVRGIPQHTADQPNVACPKCKLSEVPAVKAA